MKVVSWNCNGAFRKKYHAIDPIGADLIIVQECEDPARSTKAYREWAQSYVWHGDNKNAGIGIFVRSDLQVERLDWDDNGLQSFLPCRVDDQFILLVVWTKKADSPNFGYIGQLWKYLQLHKNALAAGPFLLCGDLNSNTCWDQWDRRWNHSDVVRELEEVGAHSLYHRFFEETQGNESRATLFHKRNRTKPYHVDYAFATASLRSCDDHSVEVGTPELWIEISDHMPLIFTIAD
jgi:exonuclease III